MDGQWRYTPMFHSVLLNVITVITISNLINLQKMSMNTVFTKTYGIDVVDAFSETWKKLAQLGLVEVEPKSVELTYTGRLFADEVGQQFYSDDMKRRMAAVDPSLISTTWPQFNK